MAGATNMRGLITTIGYGNGSWEEFIQRLRPHNIEFLIDVRTRPASRTPEFNRDVCATLLEREGIKYIYLGDNLGGMPDDPECYVDGKVDYTRCEARAEFKSGLLRIRNALEGGHRAVLMCSELDPERCHRSKLIGEALGREGVAVTHIDRDGSQVSHDAVIRRLTGGQEPLFGNEFTSVGKHAPPGQESAA